MCPVARRRRGLRRNLSGSALPTLPQSVSRGARFRGFTGSPLLRPVRLLAPLDGSDRVSPVTGGFYIQASGGSVALPAAGYDYNSNWTPLLAGLSPAGMAASLAAPDPIGLALDRLVRPVCLFRMARAGIFVQEIENDGHGTPGRIPKQRPPCSWRPTRRSLQAPADAFGFCRTASSSAARALGQPQQHIHFAYAVRAQSGSARTGSPGRTTRPAYPPAGLAPASGRPSAPAQTGTPRSAVHGRSQARCERGVPGLAHWR